MNLYKITFRSGRYSVVEDERSLDALASDLAQDGFVVVQRRAGGYSKAKSEIAIMERSVESIEPGGGRLIARLALASPAIKQALVQERSDSGFSREASLVRPTGIISIS